jgi:hypothetical protein
MPSWSAHGQLAALTFMLTNVFVWCLPGLLFEVGSTANFVSRVSRSGNLNSLYSVQRDAVGYGAPCPPWVFRLSQVGTFSFQFV